LDVQVENLEDPITPVVAILARVPREHLMLQYSLPHFQVSLFYLNTIISLKKCSYVTIAKVVGLQFFLPVQK
jgi:hypothetical protein